ncbi:helix-turn-helix domain-containing protein [Tenacibaculum xiamenense]|uniref:helix-turn-helix domain-containing protein n=1 Tax=Tenacibaculum xiamenense TaxID=1261553 RepID=UPI003893FD65
MNVMLSKKNIFLIYFLVIVCINCFSQKNEVDTLRNKSLDTLFRYYERAQSEKEKIKYIKWFIQKAKIENAENELISGYYVMSDLYNDYRFLVYSDSAIDISKKKPTKYYPMLIYLSKGIYYRKKYDYHRAIDNFLLANQCAKRNGIEKYIIQSNFGIGTIKRKIEDFEGAIKLLQENYVCAKKNNDESNTLRSLMEISNIYTEYKKIDSTNKYINLARQKALELKDTVFYHYLFINEGINYYNQKKYRSSIVFFNKAMSFFEKKRNTSYLLYPYYYIAKSFDSIGRITEALKYYKKSDSIFQLERSFSPFMRDTYITLIDYHKKENDLEMQLFYINRLLKFDSIVNQKELYVSKKIYKEYDIPKLEAEKETILQQLKTEKSNTSYIVYASIIIALTLIIFLYLQYLKRKTYKKRFEELLKGKSDRVTSKEKKANESKIEIPESIVNEIMKSLEKFEKENLYTSNQVTLAKLAKEINTNTQYLSKVVNCYKGKTFSSYLNELRINYITQKLKEDTQLRKFTIKAISEESGFNNAESFSKAFYKVNGIRPSYFLKELEKS